MKYYIIAGEASGDLHASNLINEIRKNDSQASFRCWGGDKMEAAGAELVKHYRDLAFMGFIEVVKNLKTILANIRFCKEDIQSWKPDAVILVDYPGFNMRIAEFTHKLGIPTIYYVSPQIWAWKESRVHKIKRDVDKMLVILPFEKSFYDKYNYTVDFVGHPLLDAISQWKEENSSYNRENIIALLPGSRRQEIAVKLPIMLSICEHFPEYKFAIACAPSIPESFYREVSGNNKTELYFNRTYELLSRSKAALVTSGTATLETALFGVPEVVCYKGSAISYHIAKRLIKVPFISLVNLIMNKEVVKELIQDELNTQNLVREMKMLLSDPEKQHQINEDYLELKEKLGNVGASARAAQAIGTYLEKHTNGALAR